MVESPSVNRKKGILRAHGMISEKKDWRPPTPHSPHSSSIASSIVETSILKQKHNSSNITSLRKRRRPPMPPPRYVDELDGKNAKPDGENELNFFTSWICSSLYPNGESVATEKEDPDPP